MDDFDFLRLFNSAYRGVRGEFTLTPQSAPDITPGNISATDWI